MEIIIIIRRIKKKKENEYLEYSFLGFILFSFLIALKINEKRFLLIFLIVSSILLIIRQIIKHNKIEEKNE